MGPRDTARVRKMRKALRPSLSTRTKKELAMRKAAMTRRAEWVATEDGFTWAVRQGLMRPASKLRNEVRSEEVEAEEVVDFEEPMEFEDDMELEAAMEFEETNFEEAMFDEDVEMLDVFNEDHADYDFEDNIPDDDHIDIKEEVDAEVQGEDESEVQDAGEIEVQGVFEGEVQGDIHRDSANVKAEDEGDEGEEQEEEEEEEELIPAYIDRPTARYNLRPRVAVDYRCAYKYAYAK